VSHHKQKTVSHDSILTRIQGNTESTSPRTIAAAIASYWHHGPHHSCANFEFLLLHCRFYHQFELQALVVFLPTIIFMRKHRFQLCDNLLLIRQFTSNYNYIYFIIRRKTTLVFLRVKNLFMVTCQNNQYKKTIIRTRVLHTVYTTIKNKIPRAFKICPESDSLFFI